MMDDVTTDDGSLQLSTDSNGREMLSNALCAGAADEMDQSRLLALNINCDGEVKVIGMKNAREVVMENTGKYGSICYVIRRPSCGLCREEGLTLTTMATLMDKPLHGFGLFGVIKETGVDDVGLAKFQTEFFPYPLYRDDGMLFYKALGYRRVKLRIRNPMAAISDMMKIMSRLKKKRIETTFRGEGLVQGGIVFFGPDCKPRFAYEEKTGREIPVEDILAAIDAMKRLHPDDN